jgi:hypothetical protein
VAAAGSSGSVATSRREARAPGGHRDGHCPIPGPGGSHWRSGHGSSCQGTPRRLSPGVAPPWRAGGPALTTMTGFRVTGTSADESEATGSPGSPATPGRWP